jgi:RNA polymerase sigma-70 factor (ECF subfamily)
MGQSQSPEPPTKLDPREVRAVVQLKEGNISGLEYLVKKYQLLAVRTAVLITCDRPLAEDVVQEAFLRGYQRIHQFQSQRPFGPWFIRSVANGALKAVQKKNRLSRLDPDQIESYPASDNHNGGSPEAMLEQAETNQEIWTALRRLKPERRSLLVLHYFAGLKVKDLSQVSGRPLGTVKWQLSEARQQLKGTLIFNKALAAEHKEGGKE